MRSCTLALLFMAASLLPTPAGAGLFGPSNAEECITAGLKDARTNAAVAALRSACNKQFPRKITTRPLTADEMSQLHASVVSYDPVAVRIRVHNANGALNVYRLTVELLLNSGNRWQSQQHDSGYFILYAQSETDLYFSVPRMVPGFPPEVRILEARGAYN